MATEPAPPAGNVWRFDVVAGLTAAAVVLPKAMAYAAVAGLPVAVGLYTALRADDRLRGARHVAGAERQLDDDARDPRRHRARRWSCPTATRPS